MMCGALLRPVLVFAAVLATALAASSLVHAAPTSAATQARQLGSGCEPNGLPNALAICKGMGRVNVSFRGTAVVSVQAGRVTLKGKAERVCKMKRVKRRNGTTVTRRVCSKRAKPILPRNVETRKARGYTIFVGDRLYFFLPLGTWRLSAVGVVSVSAVGEGIAGVKARVPRNGAVPQPGLISVGGELYDQWPRRWTRYEFGPNASRDKPSGDRPTRPADRVRNNRARIAVATVREQVASAADGVRTKGVVDAGRVETKVDDQTGNENASSKSIGADKGASVLQFRRSAAE